MKISIICPLYNAENYIEDLYFSIKKQKDVCIEEIKFILTESSDNTEDKLNCTFTFNYRSKGFKNYFQI